MFDLEASEEGDTQKIRAPMNTKEKKYKGSKFFFHQRRQKNQNRIK